MKTKNKSVYIFYRKEGWYSLELKDDKDAIDNAKCNPGTLKVTNTNFEIIWKI